MLFEKKIKNFLLKNHLSFTLKYWYELTNNFCNKLYLFTIGKEKLENDVLVGKNLEIL